MDLCKFIAAERGPILAEWEKFAATLLPAAAGQSVSVLRDHAGDILTAIVADLRTHQTNREQVAKSEGRGSAQRMEKSGRLHSAARLEYGFNLVQMVSEYRALRASVLHLFLEAEGTDPPGVARFNEAIDEALAETVAHYMATTERYRDQSLGILGHDLRNPLSAIVVGATVLANAEELSDNHVRIASRMLNSANRIGRMIADLLDLTRTRFGDRIPVVPAPMDLGPLCRQVVAELEGLRPAGSVCCTCLGDLRGEWDGDRIAQALSNLVRNAIQHGSTSDPIGVVARDNGDEVLVQVHNVGPTIPQKAMATLLSPWRDMLGRTRKRLGWGWGCTSRRRSCWRMTGHSM